MRAIRLAVLAALLTALGLFAYWFQPSQVQWKVDGLWLLAVCLWVVEIKRLRNERVIDLHVTRADAVPIVTVVLLFAAVWLPFNDNWRWAYTGDSIAWYEIGHAAAEGQQLQQNLLSVKGVDGNFTYLHGIGFNSLQFIFQPTLFWHRVGKLVVSCLSLAAIYTFFTLTVGRWWAIAIVVGTATNYVWLWFSYVSYAHIDSFIFYFLSLTLAMLILREPDRLGLWMLCGLLAGLAIFFTQTAWSVVLAVGVVLGVFALRTRRWFEYATYGLSAVLVALPILLQFHGLIDMTTRQAKSIYEVPYLMRIFRETVTLAYAWSYGHIGVQGAFLRWPLGPLYLAGTLLAVLAAVPPVRRWLRVPAVAPVMAALFLWDAVLMTLTNNGYGQPSTKRVYALIPLQVFFALLPLYVLHAWCVSWRWLAASVVGLTAVCLSFYAVANLRLIMYPASGIYGVNVFDGLIELRQRFPERRVTLFSSRAFLTEPLAGQKSFFNLNYHLLDTLLLQRSFAAAALKRACDSRSFVCYEPAFDGENFQRMTDTMQESLTPFPMLNTEEMSCFECPAAPLG